MIRRFALTGLAAIVALLVLMPLIWMVLVSFMAPGEAAAFPPPLFPANPTLENYRALFFSNGIGRYVANSVIVSTLATMLALLFVVPAAEEDEQGKRDQHRLQSRQDDLAQDHRFAGAVDPGCLEQLGRDRQSKLSHKEDAEDSGKPRDERAGIAVDQAHRLQFEE